MDPSTSAAQDAQAQQPADQTATIPPVQNGQSQIQQPKNPISVGISKEGSSMVMENPDVDDDDDKELQVAPQETKNRSGIGQGGDGEDEENLQTVSGSQQASADVEGQAELSPSVPEFSAGSPEVEKFVEKSPDLEKPDIPQTVQDLGVTQSGPGVIDLSLKHFDEAPIPVPFAQAAVEEKQTHMNDSKHWLMGKIMYLWRRLNPGLGTKRMKK